MNLHLSKIATLVLTGLLASSAQAFEFDFQHIADTEGEAGYAAYVRSDAGVQVTATGSDYANIGNSPNYYAYLDSGNAGLGVCKVLTSNDQCSPSSDDNVTLDEALTLVFDQQVVLNEVRFRNANHGTTFNGDIDISTDGGSSFMTIALSHLYSTPLVGTNFVFAHNATNGDQFYIETIGGEIAATGVAAPGSLLLTGSLLGFAARRRRAR
ncbi:MAG: hypothetical protein ACPGU7_03225 [Gammaproteobacteria bacterium]